MKGLLLSTLLTAGEDREKATSIRDELHCTFEFLQSLPLELLATMIWFGSVVTNPCRFAASAARHVEQLFAWAGP